MAPFFWRFQAREATGRPSQLPSCARSKTTQADRRRGRVFAAGSNSGLAELTFGPRVDAFGSSMTKAQIFIAIFLALSSVSSTSPHYSS